MRSNHLFVGYEQWRLHKAVVPPRSRLFNLEPMGLGTGLVESLTSYFCRLAEAHCVSAGSLNEHEVRPYTRGRRHMFSCTTTARTRCFTAGINSLAGAAERFSSVLGRLTGRADLHYLTMLPWKSLFPTQMLTRGVAAWCPDCLNQWRTSGKPVYIPLLWTLEIVKYCPTHQHPLQALCSKCRRPQPLLAQRSLVGFCARCKHWLGSKAGPQSLEAFSLLQPETPEWEVWVTDQMRETIHATFQTSDRLTKRKLREFIEMGVDRQGLGGFARLLGVGTQGLNDWRRGKKSPMLPVYLRLAHVLRLKLSDLLTNQVSTSSAVLHTAGTPYWQSIRTQRRPSLNLQDARQKLREALRETPAPSLRSIYQRHGYHVRTLHKRFPDLCARIIKRAAAHQKQERARKWAARIAEFREIAYELHEKGVDLFAHRVAKRMSTPRCLKPGLAQQLTRQIKREIAAAAAT